MTPDPTRMTTPRDCAERTHSHPPSMEEDARSEAHARHQGERIILQLAALLVALGSTIYLLELLRGTSEAWPVLIPFYTVAAAITSPMWWPRMKAGVPQRKVSAADPNEAARLAGSWG